MPHYADDETLRRAKLHIDKLGWWRRLPGRGLKATIYAPLDEPVEGVMSLVRQNRAARKEQHAYRLAALKAGTETLPEQHKAINEKRRKGIRGSPQNAGEMSCADEGITPLETPSGCAEGATGTVQDVAHRERTPEPAQERPPERQPVPVSAPHDPETGEIPLCHLCARLGRTRPARYWKFGTGLAYCGSHGGHSAEFFLIEESGRASATASGRK